MPLRRFVSLIHLPGSSLNDPKIFGIWSILFGITVLVLLFLTGWHFSASYHVTLLDDGALAERERENARLSEQLRALHQLDDTLERQIWSLTERAENISTIVHGTDAPGPVGGSVVSTSSMSTIEATGSPGAAIREIGGKIDLLLIEVRAELASLQSIEAQSRENEQYWRDIPVVSPVSGPVSRSFGSSRNLLSDELRVHGGLDIAASRDEPVRATADGVVSRTGVNASLGRYVDIAHQNGYTTRYGHLSKVLPKRRKQVKREEIIGLVGKTGKTSGYHIHYEIHHTGRILDPSTWFFPDPGP